MSTRSNIGFVNADGGLVASYCHYDGYPSHNGLILLSHYQDRAKVLELVNLGSLSWLGAGLGDGQHHSFDKPNRAHCPLCGKPAHSLAYGRDRHEVDVAPSTWQNLDALRDGMEEYAYVLTADGWVYSDHGNPFRSLTFARCWE